MLVSKHVRIALALALFSASFAAPVPVRADPNPDQDPPQAGTAPAHRKQEPQAPSSKQGAAVDQDPELPPGNEPRPMPSYSGRPGSSTTGEALLWVPRVLLFPVYLVSEFVIRRPLGAVLTFAEEHHLKEHWNDFFTFGEEQKIGIFPTGNIDLGLRPTAGVYFFYKDILRKSDVKLDLETGLRDTWLINSLWHVPLGTFDRLRFTARYSRRPDRAFYGLGREAQDSPVRYRDGRFEARVSYLAAKHGLSFVSYGGLLAENFAAEHHDVPSPSLGQAIEDGRFSAPPALKDGILALFTGVGARFDTRPPRITPPPTTAHDLEHKSGTGWAIGGYARHDAGLRTTRASAAAEPRLPHWLRYGASALGALDMTGTRRTLELETVLELTEPFPRENPIPFTEQVALGGDYPMRAFRKGRLVDLSAVVATLYYRWPIWETLDGSLHYAVGNVFGYHLERFAFDRLRSSFGAGIASAESLDHPFEALIAFGTRPFDEGGGIDSMRLVFGTRARY